MVISDIPKFFITQYVEICLALLLACMLEFLPTRVSVFFEGDLTISHTCGNTVSFLMMVIVITLIALILLIFIIIFVESSYRLPFIHRAAVISLRVLSNVLLFGNIFKLLIGKPRPCFFDMCQYPSKYPNSIVYGEVGTIGNITKCAASPHIVYDAMRSFPSGHSLVCGALFLLYCLLSKSILFHSVKWNSRFIVRLYYLSVGCLFLITIAISISRIIDYLHFTEDVVGGYILGVIIAILTNNSIESTYCSIIQSQEQTSKGWIHQKGLLVRDMITFKGKEISSNYQV